MGNRYGYVLVTNSVQNTFTALILEDYWVYDTIRYAGV